MFARLLGWFRVSLSIQCSLRYGIVKDDFLQTQKTLSEYYSLSLIASRSCGSEKRWFVGCDIVLLFMIGRYTE